MPTKRNSVSSVIISILAQIGLAQSPAPMQVLHFNSVYAPKINMINDGSINGLDPDGRMCVNVYTFEATEELVSCCTCQITPNGLKTLNVATDLISSTLNPAWPTQVTVMLVSSKPVKGACNAGAVKPEDVTSGLHAWGTHVRTVFLDGTYRQVMTESAFSKSQLGSTQFLKLVAYCGFIQANGSGFGICRTCRHGAE